MNFYGQSKERRNKIVATMHIKFLDGLKKHNNRYLYSCARNVDTYIRRWTYILLGRIYHENVELQKELLSELNTMLADPNEKIRQTAIYAAGEIGDLEKVSEMLEIGLRDRHHSVRNGVIGALKVMGKNNPAPTIAFASRFLHDEDPEVRRQVIHGIELHGRVHPEDILPLLREVQNENNTRVRSMIIHVLGQISYKPGCLEKVIHEIRSWENADIVQRAVIAILEVHREQNYCTYSFKNAQEFIHKELG